MEIQRANQNNIQLIEQFLRRIPSIDEVKNDLIANSSILIEPVNKEILGIISYEQFGKYGLIRYFIFQKNVCKEKVNELFLDLVDNAKTAGVKEIITVIQKEELIGVFTTMNLKQVATENIYLNEVPLKETDFYDAKVYKLTC